MQVKPIDLEGGQTASWWAVITNVETGRGYKACADNYVPNCQHTNQDTAMREPIPVLLFALVGILSDNSVIAFQLVQILNFVGIMFGVFGLGRELSGIGAGLTAALLWTLYLPAVHLETMITGDLLATLFATFGYLKFIHAVRRGWWSDWLLFGSLFALAVLSRSATLILVGMLGVSYLVYILAPRRAANHIQIDWLRKAIASALVFALILSVWVIRNWLVFGSPIVGTTLPGYVFYRHNAIVAEDVPPHYVGPDEALELVRQLALKRPELIASDLPETEINKIFMDEAIKLVQEHPLSYARLYLYRFIPLWFNIGLREQYGEKMIVTDYVIIFQQAILLVLFLLGLRKRNTLLSLIIPSLVVSILIYLGIEGQLRYLIPISSEIIVVGSLGLLSVLRTRFVVPQL
jgi:4-amino-4-deoxy-L-arabinose transferase-like glycosyltransferase